MNDRIKIAEAIGQDPGILCTWSGAESFIFDPFTDANDDYAVLEWMRENGYLQPTNNRFSIKVHLTASWDYKIGDYARAALKVLK